MMMPMPYKKNKKGIGYEYFVSIALAIPFYILIAFLLFYVIESPSRNAYSHMEEVKAGIGNDYILYNYLRTPVDGMENTNYADLIGLAWHDEGRWDMLRQQTSDLIGRAYGSRLWKLSIEYPGKGQKEINSVMDTYKIYVSEADIPSQKPGSMIKVRLYLPSGQFVKEEEQRENIKNLYERKIA